MVPSTMQGEMERTFRGAIQASDQAALSFKVGGQVMTLNVEVGDVVTADQLLAELDATELQLQLSQANASLAQARASASVAQTNRDRIQALYVNNNASAADMEAARANADATAAQVVAVARQRDLASQKVQDAQLFATRGGSVSQTLINEGELVGAGVPVVVVTSGDRLEVSFGVPGTMIARVVRGMNILVRTQTASGESIPATVTEVGLVANGATFTVTAVFDQANADLRAGLPAEVDMVFPALDNQTSLVVPLTAIGKDEEGSFVWVAKPTQDDLAEVTRTAVETGAWNADGIEALKGLTGQEHVITAGVSRVFAGQIVRLANVEQP
jgi:multidrug efflux system membrane fusion protein